MPDPVIKVEGLSKSYRIGARESYHTLRDAIVEAVAAPFKRLWRLGRPPADDENTIWALKDVSFEVQQGEVLGIIGRNGAGKSTLLKILSRITEPTEGRARIRGRVASLLEVGTGFHPELTGRENIFLNGAILGMSRVEIRSKFDEIVAFAELDKFIDTPVKRYSSGMYVRLAFAVAAHLEPEILIVDEVLAVGDAQFQRKCLGKMGEVATAGRTVLFVSHNMTAVRNLCNRALLLDVGALVQDGEVNLVTDAYVRPPVLCDSGDSIQEYIRTLPPDPAFRLDSVEVTQDAQTASVWLNGRPIDVEIRYRVLQRTGGLRVFFDLMDEELNLLFRTFHDERAEGIPAMEPGDYVSTARIPGDLLAPRTYQLKIYATIYNVRFCVPEHGVCIPLQVERSGIVNRAYPAEPIRGKLAPLIDWQTRVAR